MLVTIRMKKNFNLLFYKKLNNIIFEECNLFEYYNQYKTNMNDFVPIYVKKSSIILVTGCYFVINIMDFFTIMHNYNKKVWIETYFNLVLYFIKY